MKKLLGLHAFPILFISIKFIFSLKFFLSFSMKEIIFFISFFLNFSLIDIGKFKLI